MNNMKICFVGWTGPDLDEFVSGLYFIDPNLDKYIVGRGEIKSAENCKMFGTDKNTKIIIEPDILLDEVNKHDIMFFSSYIFSEGHRSELYSLLGKGVDFTNLPEFNKVKCIKILHDGESFYNFDYYARIVHKFDGIMTYNKKMKEYCDSINRPCFLSPIGVSDVFCELGSVCGNGRKIERDIDVVFSGSNLDKGYRKKLFDIVTSLSDRYNVIVGGTNSTSTWEFIERLNRTKIYISTNSSAGGELEPMHIKHKSLKALLCGCLPLEEYFPDAEKILEYDVHKGVFFSLDDLIPKIEYYLHNVELRNKIIRQGKQHCTDNYLYQKIFGNAMKYFTNGRIA